MEIREILNKHPKLTTGAFSLLILGAVGFAYKSWTNQGDFVPRPTKFYFTVDDGVTQFSDLRDHFTPFIHDGKEAVIAHIYSCNDGKTTFLGYLERASAKVRTDMPSVGEGQLKKPGAYPWVPKMSAKGMDVTNIHCPDGKDEDIAEQFP